MLFFLFNLFGSYLLLEIVYHEMSESVFNLASAFILTLLPTVIIILGHKPEHEHEHDTEDRRLVRYAEYTSNR